MTRKVYEYQGQTYTLSALADRLRLNRSTVYKRIQAGATLEEALVPISKGRGAALYAYKGERLTAMELARRVGVKEWKMREWLKRCSGDAEKAVEAMNGPRAYGRRYRCDGQMMTLSEFQRALGGVSMGQLNYMVRECKDCEEVIDAVRGPQHERYWHNGARRTLEEVAALEGLDVNALRDALYATHHGRAVYRLLSKAIYTAQRMCEKGETAGEEPLEETSEEVQIVDGIRAKIYGARIPIDQVAPGTYEFGRGSCRCRVEIGAQAANGTRRVRLTGALLTPREWTV